jgi:HK97 family phage portal protein
VQAGLSIQNFATQIYSNGVNPSGALEVDGKLSQQSFDRLKKDFQENFAGSSNAARALILDQGLKWKSISVSPEDAEMLATRRFTVEELCRIYGVPPTVIGDLSNSSFTNSETTIRWFAQATLAPWIRKVEAEFSRSVFSEASRRSHRLELDLAGLMRGAPMERWQSYDIAVKTKILTANEIREIEGFNPLPEPSA